MSDGEALLLQYVTKYVSKFSDANYSEWLNDEASADSIARRVCFEDHPLEPEMLLQLAGAHGVAAMDAPMHRPATQQPGPQPSVRAAS